jgi:hypothetical protein
MRLGLILWDLMLLVIRLWHRVNLTYHQQVLKLEVVSGRYSMNVDLDTRAFQEPVNDYMQGCSYITQEAPAENPVQRQGNDTSCTVVSSGKFLPRCDLIEWP